MLGDPAMAVKSSLNADVPAAMHQNFQRQSQGRACSGPGQFVREGCQLVGDRRCGDLHDETIIETTNRWLTSWFPRSAVISPLPSARKVAVAVPSHAAEPERRGRCAVSELAGTRHGPYACVIRSISTIVPRGT